jgi:hypothetical protein
MKRIQRKHENSDQYEYLIDRAIQVPLGSAEIALAVK